MREAKKKTIDLGVFVHDFVEYEKDDIHATILIHYGVRIYEGSVSLNVLEEEGIAFVVRETVGVSDETQITLREIDDEHDIFACRIWIGTATFEL